MSVIATNPVRAVVRQIKNRLARGAVILTYHRVGKSSVDPWGLFVSADHFREHLEVLNLDACVVPLQVLVRSLRERRKLPRRAVAVTFDDGYGDWFLNAKPLLERSGTPATLFLVAGITPEKRMLWWDELEAVLLRSDVLPETLQLDIKGRTHSWTLGKAACLKDKDQVNPPWRASEDPPTPRHAAYFDLWKLLRTLDHKDRQAIMHAIRSWGSAEIADDRYSLLSSAQITSLRQSALFEVGAHTLTHPLLHGMSEAEQREEIVGSKTHLEEMLNQEVASFAFPYGNYSPDTIRVVRDAGFTSACGTQAAIVRPDTNSFELPRMQVPDCDGRTFAKRLAQWFSSS